MGLLECRWPAAARGATTAAAARGATTAAAARRLEQCGLVVAQPRRVEVHQPARLGVVRQGSRLRWLCLDRSKRVAVSGGAVRRPRRAQGPLYRIPGCSPPCPARPVAKLVHALAPPEPEGLRRRLRRERGLGLRPAAAELQALCAIYKGWFLKRCALHLWCFSRWAVDFSRCDVSRLR